MSLPTPIGSTTFWINAFIPCDIFAATTHLREGEYRGLSVLSEAPCYLTDQRNFSNELRASSRMQSLARVDVAEAQPILTQSHRCDELVECDSDGTVLRRSRGSTSDMRFALTTTESSVFLNLRCRYVDPVMPPGHGIGEIEYKGTIEINPTARVICIDLMICLFPAFEAYASMDDGPASILFRYSPPAGILTLGPPRGAKRRIRTRIDDHHGSIDT